MKKLYEQIVARNFLNGRILDIGFAAKPISFTGLDISGVDLQAVKCPHNYKEIKICNLNTSQIPYPDKSFDTVYLAETLITISNPIKLLTDCNRVLVKNGGLIVVAQNPVYYRKIFEAFRLGPVPMQQLFSISRANMRAMGNLAKFEVEKELGTIFKIPFTKTKIGPPINPALAQQTIFILRKTADFNKHIFEISCPEGGPKSIAIEENLF